MASKPPTNFENVVIEAVQITDRIAADTIRLNELKDELRVEALKRAGREESPIRFPSSLGEAKVALVKDAIQLAKGANPDGLLYHLDSATWDHLFERVTKLRSDIDDRLIALRRDSKAKYALVMKLLESKPREPRVTLPE